MRNSSSTSVVETPNKKLHSLRFRMGIWFASIVIPLVLLLFFLGGYAEKLVRDQVARSNTDMLSVYLAQVDGMLIDTRLNLWKLVYDDPRISSLLLYPAYSDRFTIARAEIERIFSRNLGYYSYLDSLFLYDARDDILMVVTRGTLPENLHPERVNKIRDVLPTLLSQEGSGTGSAWVFVDLPGAEGLLRTVSNNEGLHTGAWINLEGIMKPLANIRQGEGGGVIALSSEGHPIGGAVPDKATLQSMMQAVNDSPLGYASVRNQTTRNRYLVIRKDSLPSGLIFLAIVPESGLLKALPAFQRTISLIPVLLALLVAIAWGMIRVLLYKPIDELLSGMRDSMSGNLDVRVPEHGSREFIFLIRTFNEMMTQIRTLKIDVYEESIRTQKAELRHLQAQIHPHFFANALNTVHNLALVGDTQSVQHMARKLATYFRYVTQTGKSLIRLEEEQTHVENYLSIQKFRFTDNLEWSFDLPVSLRDRLVPTLSIQPFVENAVIHGYTVQNDPLHIRVEVHENTFNSGFQICVMDTGRGFDPEVLRELNLSHDTPATGSEHIGIRNVCTRLRMQYGSEAVIRFSNNPEGGAVVTIQIPDQPVLSAGG